MLGLLTVQRTSLAIEGQLANYLKAGATLWAMISYLGLFDPQYLAKLAIIKDLATPFTAKDKEG
jgi:hypothetical protein